MLASFKHKLAVYFLLLAVAPLTAAFWGFGTVAKRAEERSVDSRLGAELRSVIASYERQADQVRALARNLASRRNVQRQLDLGRFAGLPRDVSIIGPHRLAVGRRGTIEATQTVRVKAGRVTPIGDGRSGTLNIVANRSADPNTAIIQSRYFSAYAGFRGAGARSAASAPSSLRCNEHRVFAFIRARRLAVG